MTDVVTAIFHQKWLVGKPGTALELNVNQGAGHPEDSLVIHVGATVPGETRGDRRQKTLALSVFQLRLLTMNSLMVWSLGFHKHFFLPFVFLILTCMRGLLFHCI